MADHKVRRRFDMVLVKTSIGHPELVSHNDGIADFVELRIEGIGRWLPIEQAIAWHGAVSLLLVIKQEVHRITCCRKVTIKHETCPRLVEVACKDLAIGTEVGIIGIASRDGLTPG